MRQTFPIPPAALLLVLLLRAPSSAAQTPAPASAGPTVVPEVMVTAPRGQTQGGIPPLLELSPSDLESYGVDSLADLVDALRPMTRSSRSDQQAVVLINGHLAGQVEFDNLPREAIERVEVLPETVALQYGFSENQRVLNFILREHFKAIPTRVTQSFTTDGGSTSTAPEVSYISLEDEARLTVLGSYRTNSWLRESDRGIDLPDSYDRTLLPAKTDAKLSSTLSRQLFGISSSFEASVDLTSAKSLQGMSEIGTPLDQITRETTTRLAAQFTGMLGRFVWGATASLLHIQTRSSSETGIDADGTAELDRTHAIFNGGNLQLSLSGKAVSLPAGLVVANFKFGLQYQGFDTQDAYPGAAIAHDNLVRSVRSGSFNTSIPIANRERGVWPKLGDLAATLNVSLDNVSDFGSLWSYSYGIDWIAVPKFHLDAIVTDREMAPTVQQVLAPPIFTPNVEVYDFVTGQTASVTTITGGGLNLAKTDSRVASFGVSLGPYLGKTTFSAHFERSRLRNVVGNLPPLTADVEQAFPDRFLRSADGTLVQLDNRWVNLADQDIDDLKWGFNVWVPLGETAGAPRGQSNRVEVSLFDTWYLHDTIVVRSGVPTLDLLNGAPYDESGGQPRHKIEFRSLVYRDGFGAGLSATWHSGTTVGNDLTGAPDTLRFSALGTADFRMFADFERVALTRGQPWARGARASVVVLNLFDRREAVRDALGETPVAFEPGYLDPAGRSVWLTVRKVF